jgi:Trypsin-like peptidase domain
VQLKTSASAFLVAGLQLAACEGNSREPVGLQQHAVVYGDDGRVEVRSLPAGTLAAVARSVVAVVPRDALSKADDGSLALRSETLAERFGVCDDVPFANQLSLAECTGTLVDANLVLTAGHCFEHAVDCENFLFVFDYALDEQGEVSIDEEDVYECTRSYVHENDLYDPTLIRDYALVELARRVVGRAPVPVAMRSAQAGEAVATVGSGAGLPLKASNDAQVVAARADAADYFLVDTDTAVGGSGSPVLDADGSVLGVLARGNRDFVVDDDRGCLVDNVLASPFIVDDADPVLITGGGLSDDLYAEAASYAARAVEALCATGYPSWLLCGIEPACGDTFCSLDETPSSCPNDCEVARPISAAPPSNLEPPAAAEAPAEDAPSEPPRTAAPTRSSPAPTGGCSAGAPRAEGGASLPLLLLALVIRLRCRARHVPAGPRTPKTAAHGWPARDRLPENPP